jgi:DNA-binding cell septation regulator SpoVG
LSGQIAADAAEIDEAKDMLHRRILDGRQGIFVNVPSKRAQNGRCANHCEFRELCRVDQVGRNKELT